MFFEVHLCVCFHYCMSVLNCCSSPVVHPSVTEALTSQLQNANASLILKLISRTQEWSMFLPNGAWHLQLIYALTGVICRTRIELLPPDLIWPEWFSGHGHRTMANRRRPMAAYRYNLLEHIGAVSSFKVRVDRPAFPKCYESMADVWSLARAERFQVMPEERFCPCNGTPMCQLCSRSHTFQCCLFCITPSCFCILSSAETLLTQAVLCCAVLCRAVRCRAVLCCAVLCYAVLCCAVTACVTAQNNFSYKTCSSLAGCYNVCIVLFHVAGCIMFAILVAGKEVPKQRLVSMHYGLRC